MHEITITLTPDEVTKIPAQEKETLIVIDTLRASTTIITALAHGAREVIPFAGEEELRSYYQRQERKDFLLGGEKGGKAISGFDLDNSPLNYVREQVQGKSILFKTSNGTRVLEKLTNHQDIYIGALVNSQKVVEKILALNQDVYLVCAGSNGAFSLEDFFTAGCFSSLLKREGWQGDDLVTAAVRIYEDNQEYQEIINLFQLSRNGQNLLQLGYKRDIEFAARVDEFSVLPYFKDGRIIL